LPAPTRYRHLRRNFALFLLDYIAFGVAFSLVASGGAVIPSFVSQLTDSKQLIGLAGAMYTFCWLVPQLLMAQAVNRGTRRKPFVRPVVPFRLAFVAMALIIAANPPGGSGMTLAVFLGVYWFFAAGDALITLVWGDMLGSSVPHHLRGVMFGIGQFGVAMGALGTSTLARWALGPSGLPFPQNYALLFGVAGALFVIGGIGLMLIIEEEVGEPVEPGPPLREYVPYLLNILRHDRGFLRFTRTRLLIDLAMMAAPFYVIFAVSMLGLRSDIVVSDSIILIQLGSASGAVLMGWISRRSGSRAVIILAAAFIVLEPSLALVSYLGGGQVALYMCFYMLGAFHSVAIPSYFDWIITHSPPSRRPIYIGLTNTISAVSSLAPFLGGTLLQLTAQHPAPANWPLLPQLFGGQPMAWTAYPLLFGTAIALALAGLISARALHEPRQRAAEALPQAAGPLPEKTGAGH
jgi:MFS family permease